MQLKIERLTYGGDGLGRHEGMVWFVPYTAAGDLIEVEETQQNKNFRRGRVVQLIEASPDRTEPPCPLFGRCGGCQWQHISYQTQLRAKDQILTESAARSLKIDVESGEPIASPQDYEYRQRITLHRCGAEFGYFAAGSRELIPVNDCLIAAPPIRRWLKERPLTADQLKTLPERFELRLTSAGDVRLIRDTGSAPFLQANKDGNRILQEMVRSLILSRFPRPRLFDLFCGDGNLSLPLMEEAASISGWDISVKAIREAARSSAGRKQVEYRHGNVAEIEAALRSKASSTDVVLLDPPRQGIRGSAAFIASLQIPAVIYVSCNPSTLMRDLRPFIEAGYRIEHLQVLDMFPQSYHMESITLLAV